MQLATHPHLTYPLIQLTLNDGSNTPVAQSHRQHFGILKEKRKAGLEIYPGFEHLVDIIVITFIYVETLRDE
jgi:hypothetical protein